MRSYISCAFLLAAIAGIFASCEFGVGQSLPGSGAYLPSAGCTNVAGTVTCPGTFISGATGATGSGSVLLNGKTSGNTVALTVGDTTAAGTVTVPGVTGTMAYVASAQTSGRCAQFGSDGIGLTQASGACGTGGAGALAQIAQVTTTSNATSVAFSSIPSTYTNLRITWTCRSQQSATNDGLYVLVNGDATAANYSAAQYILAQGSASGGTVPATTSGGFFANVAGATATAGFPSSGSISFNSYATTVFYKRYIHIGGYSVSSSTEAWISTTGTWLSTAAINAVSLNLTGHAFVDGSVFTLYGEQ